MLPLTASPALYSLRGSSRCMSKSAKERLLPMNGVVSRENMFCESALRLVGESLVEVVFMRMIRSFHGGLALE